MPTAGPDPHSGRYIPAVGETGSPPQETAGWSRGRIVGVTVGIVVAAGILLLLVLGLARSNGDGQLFERSLANDNPPAAPDFTLPVLSAGGDVGPAGSTLTLSSLRGRPVLVNLWASWCPPCQDEAPILERLWQRNRAKGLVVLGVDTQDGSDAARAFVAKYRLTYPSVRDGEDGTQRKFQTGQLPETFLIDSNGKVRLVYRGQLTTASEREINGFLAKGL